MEKCSYTPYRWKGRPGPKQNHTGMREQPVDRSAGGALPGSSSMTFTQMVPHSSPIGLENLQTGPIQNTDWQNNTQDVDGFIDMLGMDLQGLVTDGASQPDENEISNMFRMEETYPEVGKRLHGSNGVLANPPLAYAQQDCHRIIMALLEPQHQFQPPCKTAKLQSKTRSSIENVSSNHIMKINRCSLQHLQALVSRRCSPVCLSGLETVLLLQSVCTGVLNRYQSVYRSMTQAPIGYQMSAADSHENTAHKIGNVVFDPVQFGDFPLGRQAETRMNAELLSCEIHSLSSVVAQIVGIQGSKEDGHAQDHQPSTPGVHLAFEKSINSRIDELKLLIRQFCNTVG
ncbi:hypothetical protein BKA67DRAFT_650795 [Truncatella angustata]|uniref:Uncharacterized protein n=1 Tax=Truncatella angustata TaxID=152316 RepID=A0A9P8RHK8_9PEZI|nr:uncharacterized protein BKA67DRAFT_650795 [Truncatella angustata]KAH6646163.1 hypothetical protein BKA67DRAFT_650795 [Truncatella angustata]